MKGSVIIIGAGVSGLYAGTLLEKAGVEKNRRSRTFRSGVSKHA